MHRSSVEAAGRPAARHPPQAPPNVCVIVLGDLDRSPRMQYHAASLLQHGCNVDVIGYAAEPLAKLRYAPDAKIHALAAFPETNLPRVLRYVFKTFWAFLTLLGALLYVRRPHFVLVQNPPAIPALIVCRLYCAVTRARLIIDWHNYTHTILALDGGPDRLVVRTARWVERRFGRKANGNLCVTRAMRDDLQREWDIAAQVFYDRPAPQFQPIGVEQRHELFGRLADEYPLHFGANAYDGDDEPMSAQRTAFTERIGEQPVQLRARRPALLVSSTSWTADEDFGVLLEALQVYERTASETPAAYPDLLCVITGRGPLRQHYLDRIDAEQWKRVRILTPWLTADDYPRLLAAADLGVSLHRSSSGLDLPMKVVDMFGCGLPVAAFRFNCIEELVQHEANGFLFDDARTLAEQICSWFEHYPNNISLVNLKEHFAQNLRKFQSLRWTENWNNVVWPMFQR